MAKLTASSETSAALTATFTGQYPIGEGETNAALTATTDLTPDVIIEGRITAAAADSIAVLSRKEIRLAIAGIVDGIRILLDEVACAISSYALIVATVYSGTVIASYLISRITRDMPMARLVRGLLDRLASV